MGILTVVDHTEQRWAYRHRKINRENGASTYSKEIVEYHLPLWKHYLSDIDATVGTCPRMLNMEHLGGDLAVQYLHTYRYKEGLHDMKMIDAQLSRSFSRRIYVTAYKSLAVQARLYGYEAIHLPMAIDTALVEPVRPRPEEHRGERSAAYYGNILGGKVNPFKELRAEFLFYGWSLTQISGPQRDSWHELLKFDYGVGVGRCALEMGYLGLKVMISGNGFGGIVTSEAEKKTQLDTNSNARVCTFDREISSCLAAWDSALPYTLDVKEVLPILEEYLKTL